METSKSKRFVVAGHEVLFAPPREGGGSVSDDVEHCDACGEPISHDESNDESTSTSYAVGGRGRYLWTRGDERRSEEPPLCPSCAAAIGMTALAQWGVEEEEG